MSLVIANATFSYKKRTFTHGAVYDTADPDVSDANTTVPHLFYASGGTKTAKDTFVFKDPRAGGVERIVYIGEVLPSGDAAVTADGNHIK